MKEKIKAIFGPRTNNNNISKDEIKNGKFLATICYIFAPLVYLTEKDNDYVIYHSKQGMNLFTFSLIYLILDSYLRKLFVIEVCNTYCEYSVSPIYLFISGLCSLLIVIFMGIGIFNVSMEKVKPLPVIGNIKIFK